MSYGTICWNIKPPQQSVVIPNNFSISTAVDLMQLCFYTYNQYDKYIANEEWTIPAPYKLEKTFYYYDDSKKVPFGFIATSDNNKDVYICFRGTRTVSELKKNLNIELAPCSFLNDSNSKVHKGFQEVYVTSNSVNESLGSLRTQMLDYLNTDINQDYTTIWVSGHSLGAAIATLAVVDIVTNTSHIGARMYNFASPLVGDQDFADYFKSKIGTNQCDKNNNSNNTCSWRIVNINDEVRKIPPQYFGYVHVNGCSGLGICNNSGCSNSNSPECNNNDSSKNGLFEIEFEKRCNFLFTDITCFEKAHRATTYLSKLQEINNIVNQ
jgi:triacylglycerol lipase